MSDSVPTTSQLGPRARDGETTREALMAAATELFAAFGYDGTTVDAIAARARVNKAMISYHFQGKHGLYTAILRRDFGWMQDQLDALGSEPIAADRKLKRFVAIFGELHKRRPGLSAMMLREAMSGGRYLDATIVPVIKRIFGAVQAIVGEGVADGSFRPVDPLFMHHTVVGTLVFFFAAAPLRDRMIREGVVPLPRPDPDAFVAHVQDLLSRGLAKES